jgi:hypothetical protein
MKFVHLAANTLMLSHHAPLPASTLQDCLCAVSIMCHQGAVSAVTTVTGAVVDTVGTVVTTTAGAVGSVGATVGGGLVNIGKGAADTLTGKSGGDKGAGPAALITTPASWLFGAGKAFQQQTAKAMASMRLSKVSVSAQGPPTKPQWIVVAGFTAEEAGSDLLPHFLAFAPPGSTVVFVVHEGQELPEGLQQQGIVEETEEREDGGEPIKHLINYRCVLAECCAGRTLPPLP